jgi:hypothetical protein
VPNQATNWYIGRAGWCPGTALSTFNMVFSVPPSVRGTSANISYAATVLNSTNAVLATDTLTSDGAIPGIIGAWESSGVLSVSLSGCGMPRLDRTRGPRFEHHHHHHHHRWRDLSATVWFACRPAACFSRVTVTQRALLTPFRPCPDLDSYLILYGMPPSSPLAVNTPDKDKRSKPETLTARLDTGAPGETALSWRVPDDEGSGPVLAYNVTVLDPATTVTSFKVRAAADEKH